MSLLNSIVTQVVTSAISGGQSQQQGGLGGALGGLLGGQGNNSALGGVLGSIVAGQLGGQNQANAGLGGLLGGTQQKPTDLGSVLGSVLGSQKQAGGLNKSALLLALLPIVLGYIQKNGGLSATIAKITGSDVGLSNKAQSWISSIDQDNDGIDADDVMRMFGQDEIDRACQQTGASQDDVCQGIAELLPKVVNDLTPHGDVQADEQVANDEINQILAGFQKAF